MWTRTKPFGRAPVAGAVLCLAFSLLAGLHTGAKSPHPNLERFRSLILGEEVERAAALDAIASDWEPGFGVMALEVMTLTPHPETRRRLIDLLEKKTRRSFGGAIERWYQWIWAGDPQVPSYYGDFKAAVYGILDPRFGAYFDSGRRSRIRLDEVRWGGVLQDGIPPLRSPKMLPARAATYLRDDSLVFGIEVNGDVRAYPKRILAWHEMFVDRVGDVPVTGVYCTLCGAMILYHSVHAGVEHELGTSGFLYRSNKLMYDRRTQSLWNTLWGEPVIGPLAGESIRLKRLPVVTTTWGEWRRRHPATTVLSLETGYERDYGEGVAYRGYFATDKLMFSVPERDTRLKNKDEVVGLTLGGMEETAALWTEFLVKNPIHHDRLGGRDFVVLTDRSGANRVYDSGGVVFTEWDGNRTVRDDSGTGWRLDEAGLTSGDGRVLKRLPAHRAFWFGWYSAYPQTRLVK